MPAFAPLILSHDLILDGIGVSEYVTSFEISGEADTIVIPSTASRNVESYAAGAERWKVKVNYIQSEGLNSLTEILWDVFLNDPEKTMAYSGKMRDTSSKRYAGIVIVSEVMKGGDVNSLGVGSFEFFATARPTVTNPGS